MSWQWINLGQSVHACVEDGHITSMRWRSLKCSTSNANNLVRDYANKHKLVIDFDLTEPRKAVVIQDDPNDKEPA